MNKALFSSNKHDWETPQDFFDEYDKRFNFTLDVCASEQNAKCEKYFSEEDDGLAQDWSQDICWMNPPYGREIRNWVKKAYKESIKGATVVCLLPSRTDTRWWHDYVMGKAEVIFIKGRLKFVGAKHSAPFPSAVVIYQKRKGCAWSLFREDFWRWKNEDENEKS